MTGRSRLRTASSGERGAVLVLFAVFAPVAILFFSFTIDIGNTFWHARHLQAQADAAALASAQEFSECNNENIYRRAGQYGGASKVLSEPNHTVDSFSPLYNTQIGGTKQDNMNLVINSKTYYPKPYSPGSTTHVDPTAVEKPPCEASMVDVKLTETNLPWYVKVFKSAFNGVPYDNAHARVELLEQTSTAGAEPFVEPLPTPNAVSATLVDEENGKTIAGPFALTPNGDQTSWETPLAGVAVKFSETGKTTFPVGMRIAMSTGTTASCGTAGVTCYQNDGTQHGVTFTRVWENPASEVPGQPTGEPVAPKADDVNPVTSGASACPVGPGGLFSNFVSLATSTTCAVQVTAANVQFAKGTGAPAISCKNAALKLNKVNLKCPETENEEKEGVSLNGKAWTSEAVTIARNEGLKALTLEWELKAGKLPKGGAGGNKGVCTEPNPCTGTLAVQRVNSGAYNSPTVEQDGKTSGPILGASITGPHGEEVMSVASKTEEQVHIAIKVFAFENAKSIEAGTPNPVELTFGGSQGNGALACNGTGSSAFEAALAEGCSEVYGTTTAPGTTGCPGSPIKVCVKTNPGGGKLEKNLDKGMNQRINGSQTTTECVHKNHWTTPNTIAQIVAQSPPDPRLIVTIITDPGELPNGSTEKPVRAFATFYVTGWEGDPCLGQANGTSGGLAYTHDDQPTGGTEKERKGVLLGHFIKYINVDVTKETGSGKCQLNSLDRCIAVLSR